jgi:ferritin-like metal-binding protein YciE
MMNSMVGRLENYPELRRHIQTHIAETEGQITALDGLLDKWDTDSSMFKDAVARIAATGQALGGMFAGDEVVKGAMASYTFEQMEIATYRILIATAERLGDVEAVAIFRRILAQEQAMADWLAGCLDQTTLSFLARDEADLPAAR